MSTIIIDSIGFLLCMILDIVFLWGYLLSNSQSSVFRYTSYPSTCLFAFKNCRQVNSLSWECFDLLENQFERKSRGVRHGSPVQISWLQQFLLQSLENCEAKCFLYNRSFCPFTANLVESAECCLKC